jgi:hypothetical protein
MIKSPILLRSGNLVEATYNWVGSKEESTYIRCIAVIEILPLSGAFRIPSNV